MFYNTLRKNTYPKCKHLFFFFELVDINVLKKLRIFWWARVLVDNFFIVVFFLFFFLLFCFVLFLLRKRFEEIIYSYEYLLVQLFYLQWKNASKSIYKRNKEKKGCFSKKFVYSNVRLRWLFSVNFWFFRNIIPFHSFFYTFFFSSLFCSFFPN